MHKLNLFFFFKNHNCSFILSPVSKTQNVSKSTPEMLQVRDEQRHGKHNEDRGGKMEKWQNESRDMLCYIKHEDEPHFT